MNQRIGRSKLASFWVRFARYEKCHPLFSATYWLCSFIFDVFLAVERALKQHFAGRVRKAAIGDACTAMTERPCNPTIAYHVEHSLSRTF
jgi:hypothetical protein